MPPQKQASTSLVLPVAASKTCSWCLGWMMLNSSVLTATPCWTYADSSCCGAEAGELEASATLPKLPWCKDGSNGCVQQWLP